MKRKKIDLYLLDTDIETLNKRYSELYKQVKNDTDLTTQQMDRACEILLAKYNFEIEELCKLREPEYWEQQAKTKAKDREQTPWRRCWLWRLLFQPLTNRAQDIIEEEAALDAEERFAPLEEKLKERAAKLYPTAEQPRHWWQRIFHKNHKTEPEQPYLITFENLQSDTAAQEPPEPVTPSEDSNAAHDASDAAHQSGDKAKEIAELQLEEIIKQADKAAPEEAFNQPEPSEPVQTPEKPKKQRRRRNSAKTPAQPDDVPPAPALSVPAPQITGQINIEEIQVN